MKRATAIVAEDEASQRQALVQLLQETWPELEVLAECEDGLAALEALDAHRPDVAFLDIRMPGLSGLAAVAQTTAQAHVVFTTAHAEHAAQAFEHGAVDYVLKPVSRDRLQVAVDRVRKRLEAGEHGDAASVLALLHQQRPTRPLHWISASVGNSVRMIPLDEVLFFQSSDKYTRVAARQGEAIIRTPLKDLLAGLDPDEFWQVHRGVIVRVAIVRAMHALGGERYELELTGTMERVPVSAAFKLRFRGM